MADLPHHIRSSGDTSVPTWSALFSSQSDPPEPDQSSLPRGSSQQAFGRRPPHSACAWGWKCGWRSQSSSPQSLCTLCTRVRSPWGGAATAAVQSFLRAWLRSSGSGSLQSHSGSTFCHVKGQNKLRKGEYSTILRVVQMINYQIIGLRSGGS